MNKMKKFTYILLSLLFVVVSACSDFLDKTPSASTNAPVESVSQLLALIDNIPTLAYETSNNIPARSDDNEVSRELYQASPNSFSIDRMYYLANFLDGIVSQASDGLWSGLYSNIYRANLIINNIDKVSGSDEVREIVRVNAHFLRAYSYWVLVNTYSLPYSEANLNSLGVPKKLRTDFEESLKRVPQQEIYDLIESDLTIAEQTKVTNVDPSLPWRVTKNTTDSFRARLYLYQNNYDKALEYAAKAVLNAPDLLDYNTLGWANPISYPETDDLPAQTLHYSETHNWGAAQFLFWQEWIYPRLANDRSQWFLPSKELVDLYDHDNDLRFDLMYVEHGNRRFSVPYEAYRYNFFNDGRYTISGLTTAEVILIKAESQIRTGDWQTGLQTLDALRIKRYKTGTYSALSAANQSDALKIVLEERRRELPFAFRMYDIRRFSVNETPEDDVVITREFFKISLSGVDVNTPETYTIPVGSPLYALPINEVEINASRGEIEQNQY